MFLKSTVVRLMGLLMSFSGLERKSKTEEPLRLSVQDRWSSWQTTSCFKHLKYQF